MGDLDEAEEMTVNIGGVITRCEDLDKEKTEAEVEEKNSRELSEINVKG